MPRNATMPERREADGFRHFLLPVGIVASMVAGAAAAEDPAGLPGSCFAHTYDAAYLAAHPGQRVTAMSIQFQEFDDNLLASVIYALRYGTKFGFSGACYVKIEGGYLCDACANDDCNASGEHFVIMWPGGDRVKIVNDLTGMLAKNAQGGRDYLPPGGEHAAFILERGSPQDCAW